MILAKNSKMNARELLRFIIQITLDILTIIIKEKLCLLPKVQVYKKSWSCFSGDNKGNQRQQSSEYQSLYHYFYAFCTVVGNQ